MNKYSIQELAKIQNFVYVIDEDNLLIYKYPISKITYAGVKIIIDIPTWGDIETFATELEAQEYMRYLKEVKIEELNDEIGDLQVEIIELERDIELKRNIEVIEVGEDESKNV